MNDPVRSFEEIANPTTKDAVEFVYAKATYYPRFARVFIPYVAGAKLREGFELAFRPEGAGSPKETNEERSRRRTRKSIKDITLCTSFDQFVTFTFNCRTCGQNCNNDPCICNDTCQRFNPDVLKSKMSNWLKRERKRKGPFEYLIVPEFHKDGKAIHFHALISGYPGKVIPAISKKTGKQVVNNGRLCFNFPSYTLGHCNVKLIDKKEESLTRVAFYVQKYITKEMPTFFGKNRYWVSHGVSRPPTESNPQPWYLFAEVDREYLTDFGIVYEFDAGKNPLVDIFIEANNK